MADSALKLTTKVLPGHRVEFMAPELPDGADIDVQVALSGAADEDDTRQRFEALSSRWHNDTALLSSITDKAMHPAYQAIIGLGREAVPYILQELKKQPGHWFWALSAITGENPVRPDQQGQMREMAAAWVRWGDARGYLT